MANSWYRVAGGSIVLFVPGVFLFVCFFSPCGFLLGLNRIWVLRFGLVWCCVILPLT